MEKNNKSMRLQHYNYLSNGYYFVTICTQDKIKYFGIIENEKIKLNNYGKIVKNFWEQIPLFYKNIYLDEFIIMPNHIHGIIIIDKDVPDEQCSSVQNKDGYKQKVMITKKNYGLLSKIIKSFKEACIKQIRKEFNDYDFFWMKSYYDHIIRNDDSLNNIRNYIKYNYLKEYDNDKIINYTHCSDEPDEQCSSVHL